MTRNQNEEDVVVQVNDGNAELLTGLELRADGKTYLKAGDLQNLTRKANNLSMLMDSARSIMAEMEMDTLLQLIMERVTRVMRADRSTLFLTDKNTNEIVSRVSQGSSEIRLPMGQGIAGTVAKDGQTINIPDAYEDERFSRAFDEKTGYRTKSILCMGIYDPRGNIIGAIQVLNKADGTFFAESDEQLLGAFSSLAGISLANAKAYDELEKERDLLEFRVRERTKDLEESRKKSDELLLNILPKRIADELKSKGKAETRSYDQVSVMFTDFKGFTQVAEQMEPELLIKSLDECFFYFDEVVERHKLEKIKTIGDSYMCAGGIPRVNRSNPIESVLAALEIQQFMAEMAHIKAKLGKPFWELRLGIHTGQVIAGVVGKKKFAYDIWGDTVNTASRMESSGEPGKVNVSRNTYELIKEYFDCTHRGKIHAKNKGDIDMYFVESIKPEYSIDGEGQVPSDEFIRFIDRLRYDSTSSS